MCGGEGEENDTSSKGFEWHCWLVQQWMLGTDFALLSKSAVSPDDVVIY